MRIYRKPSIIVIRCHFIPLLQGSSTGVGNGDGLGDGYNGDDVSYSKPNTNFFEDE